MATRARRRPAGRFPRGPIVEAPARSPFDDLCGVPFVALRIACERLEQHLVMGPAQLCSQWLHVLRIRPQRGKAPHVEEVAAGESAGAARVGAQVLADPTDDVVAPSERLLPIEGLPP